MGSQTTARRGTRLVLGAAALVSGLLVTALVVFDALRPPAQRDAVAPEISSPTAPAAPVARRALPPVPITQEALATASDRTADEAATHAAIARQLLVTEFIDERGRLLRDRALAERLAGRPDAALFADLIARSAGGDAQASLALALMNDFVCDEFATFTSEPDWERDIRRALTDTGAVASTQLSEDDREHFRHVNAALVTQVLALAPLCAAVLSDMGDAVRRLERHADEGDGPALIALAFDSTHRREQLAGRLDEFDGEILYEALDVLHVTDGCGFHALIEPIAARHAQDNALFAGLLARMLELACGGPPVDDREMLALHRRAALGGERNSYVRYRHYLNRLQPDDARIELYAMGRYWRRLIRAGCIGMEHFALGDWLFRNGDLARGTHLSPYEHDAALVRAQALWEEHAAHAMQLRRCRG